MRVSKGLANTQTLPASKITPVHSSAAIASSYTYVTIQPPAGETWMIYVAAMLFGTANTTATSIKINYYNGATIYGGVKTGDNGAGAGQLEDFSVGCQGFFRCTNTNYVRISYYHDDPGNLTRSYSYWGYVE